MIGAHPRARRATVLAPRSAPRARPFRGAWRQPAYHGREGTAEDRRRARREARLIAWLRRGWSMLTGIPGLGQIILGVGMVVAAALAVFERGRNRGRSDEAQRREADAHAGWRRYEARSRELDEQARAEAARLDMDLLRARMAAAKEAPPADSAQALAEAEASEQRARRELDDEDTDPELDDATMIVRRRRPKDGP